MGLFPVLPIVLELFGKEMHMEERILNLQRKANLLRKDVVEMIGVGKAGHLGGSCSLAEIVSVLYFSKMRHDPANPKMPDRDRLILSKGHAGLIQYAALAECGYFPKEWLQRLKRAGKPPAGASGYAESSRH